MPYFLDQLRSSNAPVNWPLVEHLTPYGGIRIEDNIHVQRDQTENLTRRAFSTLNEIQSESVNQDSTTSGNVK